MLVALSWFGEKNVFGGFNWGVFFVLRKWYWVLREGIRPDISGDILSFFLKSSTEVL